MGNNCSSCTTVFDTTEDIPDQLFKQDGHIKGFVISVTDGDTFRLRHKVMFSDGKFRGKLQECTIIVRIAGVDTPETAKYGKEGQPFGDEAKEWVKEELFSKEVTVQLLSRDQYQRAVGMVTYGTWPFQKNLSEELLKRGLAVIYRQGGAEYGGKLQVFEKLEQEAKDKKIGIWGGDFETPAEFKKRQREQK